MLLLRRVGGKSLEPIYRHGQLVLGLRTRRLRVGKIILFEHEGHEKLKLITDVTTEKVFVEGTSHYSSDSHDFGWIDRTSIKAIIIWPRFKN